MCRLHLCFVPVILTHLIESQACGSQESQGIGPEPQLRTTDGAYRWSLWPHEATLAPESALLHPAATHQSNGLEGRAEPRSSEDRAGPAEWLRQAGRDSLMLWWSLAGVAMSMVLSQRISLGLFGT